MCFFKKSRKVKILKIWVVERKEMTGAVIKAGISINLQKFINGENKEGDRNI